MYGHKGLEGLMEGGPAGLHAKSGHRHLAGEEPMPGDVASVRLGDADECLRNVMFNGLALEGQVVSGAQPTGSSTWIQQKRTWLTG